MPLDIVNGDAVLVSIHFVTPQNACISREPCPRFFNIVSLQTHSNGYTLALLGPLMQFHLSDYFPMCMRQETVEDASSYAFWDPAPPLWLFSWEPLQLFCVNEIEAEHRSRSIKHLNLISRFHSWQNKKREQGTGSHRIEPMQ